MRSIELFGELNFEKRNFYLRSVRTKGKQKLYSNDGGGSGAMPRCRFEHLLLLFTMNFCLTSTTRVTRSPTGG